MHDIGTAGITPENTDPDGIPDYLDSDSDNDNVTDCIEGIRDDVATSKVCPITTNMVGVNGLAGWAENADDYTNPAGLVTAIPLKNTLIKPKDTSYELAYRDISKCGNVVWELKANQWKAISAPCIIHEPITTIFADLGTYGDANGQWTMYAQTTNTYTGGPDSDYPQELPSTHKMTVPGIGYWIISAVDKNITINESTLSVSPVVIAPAQNHSATSPDFSDVYTYDGSGFGNGSFPFSGTPLKFLAGNPFPTGIQVGNMFISGDDGANYYPMYDTAHISSFAKDTIYTYDYTGRNHVYDAKVPSGGTPGFGDVIEPGIGFWMRFEGNKGPNIRIEYPLEN